ncbi:hypothetical protein ACUX5C_25105, partial [Salmonella enterica]
MSIKNDGHYFCRAGGNRPDGLNEPVTLIQQEILLGLVGRTMMTGDKKTVVCNKGNLMKTKKLMMVALV